MALIGAIFAERRIRRRDRRRESPPPAAFPTEGFFAARADELDDSVVQRGPAGRFPGVSIRGITEAHVARLGKTIVAGEYADLLAAIHDATRRYENAVLFRVPVAIRDRLGSAELRSAAERWSDAEELRRAGWTYADARAVLGQLQLLASEAQASGADLWLWRA